MGVVGVVVSWSSKLDLDLDGNEALPFGDVGLATLVEDALRPGVGGGAGGASAEVFSLELLDREDSLVDDLPGVLDEEDSFRLKLYRSVSFPRFQYGSEDPDHGWTVTRQRETDLQSRPLSPRPSGILVRDAACRNLVQSSMRDGRSSR
jgi:hypothetical protein